MTDPFKEFNEGVQRAMDAYWHATSPEAEALRARKRRERKRRNQRDMRTRVRLARDGAA